MSQPDSVEQLATEMRRVRGGAEHPGPPGCVCRRCRWAARMEALFAAERERYAKLLAALERIEGEIIEEPEEIGPDEHGYCWKYDRATLAARLRAAREGGK